MSANADTNQYCTLMISKLHPNDKGYGKMIDKNCCWREKGRGEKGIGYQV